MYKRQGCEFVILGHSERRSLYAESDTDVGVKASVAAAKGLTPIICVGETREERESNVTADVVCRLLDAVIDGAGIDIFPKALIAYEPVWAIGTGKTATPEQAQEVHASIRAWLAMNVSPAIAKATRIQYGGSVNDANVDELMACPDIDGALVGGASLKPEIVDIVAAIAK